MYIQKYPAQIFVIFFYRKYHGSFNPLLGLLYMKIGKILMHCEQDKEALHNLKKAADIIQITHGHQHSLYQTQLLPLLAQCQAFNDYKN